MAAENAPTRANPWTLHNLPVVVAWDADDVPRPLAGPPTTADPWMGDEGWNTVHIVAIRVADEAERGGGKDAILRRLAATARAHGWRWHPAVTAQWDGARAALGIAVHDLARPAAVELARGAGQRVVLELGTDRLRLIDLVTRQMTTVRRRHVPPETSPPWLTSTSELLAVWRGRHRAALDPIGAGTPDPAAHERAAAHTETPGWPPATSHDSGGTPSCPEPR